jgi:DNA segregation ATPase FtsK/SpoIIIE-like protein
LTVTLDTGVLPSELDLTMGERSPADSRLGLYETVAEIVSAAALIYDPAYVTFGPRRYFSKQVFDSRPGASWLLYLPRTLSVDQVPEARSLIPVLEGKKQRGTIVVSVIDEMFSADNAEHVKVANAIETRRFSRLRVKR